MLQTEKQGGKVERKRNLSDDFLDKETLRNLANKPEVTGQNSWQKIASLLGWNR